jgi:hypothetical protein
MTGCSNPIQARPARVSDAPAIAAIYNQGIEDRVATFETEPRSPQQIVRWFDSLRPIATGPATPGSRSSRFMCGATGVAVARAKSRWPH